MFSPQRHGPSKYEKPQILAVPQEITDIIESHLDKLHRPNSIKALRLTCRTFSEGLFTTFISEYFESFTFYLNEKGAEDIEWLANSRLAPYVQTVELADRQPSLAVLEYREVNEEKKEHNLTKFDETIDKLLARKNVYVGSPPSLEAFREINFILPRPIEWDNSFRAVVCAVHHCSRCLRHGSDFDALFPGWDVKWRFLSCVEVRELDLRPSSQAMQRLADALGKFPNLREISSQEAAHGLLRAVNLNGEQINSVTSLGKCDWQRQTLKDCACHSEGLQYGSSALFNEIIWPAAVDLSLLILFLSPTLPLFMTITRLELNFYSKTHIEAALELQNKNDSLLANFVLRCISLADLRLRTKNLPEDHVPAIGKVVAHLAESNAHFASLRRLCIEHIDPTSPASMYLLKTHAAQLEALNLTYCLPAPNDTYLERWVNFALTLSVATHLVECNMWFLNIYDDARVRAQHETLRNWVKWGYGSRPIHAERFRKMAETLRAGTDRACD